MKFEQTSDGKYVDYYETLGVARTATQQEIQSAFRKLSLRYHPDKNQGDSKATEMFKKLNNYASVLQDPEQRADYDRALASNDTKPAPRPKPQSAPKPEPKPAPKPAQKPAPKPAPKPTRERKPEAKREDEARPRAGDPFQRNNPSANRPSPNGAPSNPFNYRPRGFDMHDFRVFGGFPDNHARDFFGRDFRDFPRRKQDGRRQDDQQTRKGDSPPSHPLGGSELEKLMGAQQDRTSFAAPEQQKYTKFAMLDARTAISDLSKSLTVLEALYQSITRVTIMLQSIGRLTLGIIAAPERAKLIDAILKQATSLRYCIKTYNFFHTLIRKLQNSELEGQPELDLVQTAADLKKILNAINFFHNEVQKLFPSIKNTRDELEKPNFEILVALHELSGPQEAWDKLWADHPLWIGRKAGK